MMAANCASLPKPRAQDSPVGQVDGPCRSAEDPLESRGVAGECLLDLGQLDAAGLAVEEELHRDVLKTLEQHDQDPRRLRWRVGMEGPFADALLDDRRQR